MEAPHVDAVTLLADDHLRPRYHFLPPKHWMNDPNGLIQWQGVYHLFYQHNPHGSQWGRIHWGHASSADLVHWEHHPIALTPGPEPYDEDGCWSGCAVDADGVASMLYTGSQSGREAVCLAQADPRLTALHKHPHNPVIAHPPAGLDTVGFRDPCVWREGNTWQLLLGSGIRGQGGAVLHYTSPDLLQWEYQGPLCLGDGSTGAMWECPAFFPLGDRQVLLVSALPQERVLAFIGSYEGNRFVPDTWQWVDGGAALYAPQVMRDQHDRRLFFAWIKEERDAASQERSGWSGILSLPRVICGGDGVTGSSMAMEPIAELAQLRMNPRTLRQDVPTHGQVLLPTNRHGQWEVELALEQTEGLLTLSVEEVGGQVLTAIELDLTRHCARLCAPEDAANGWASFTAPAGTPIRFRCFFDHSVLECFVQEQVSLTKRVYPSRASATQVTLAFVGDPDGIQIKAQTWDMQDASGFEALTR
jgi:beta-fructofuranosidase